jgi:hypothetical protein
LIGTKSDRNDLIKVQLKEAKDYAFIHNMEYFETSAENNQNIEEAMNHILEASLENRIQNELIRASIKLGRIQSKA